MAKKIFFGSLGLFIIVLIFLGAYNFAFKNNANNPVEDLEKRLAFDKSKDAPLPSIENPLNEAVIGVVGSADSKLYYYSFDEKSLKRADLDGKNKTILLSNLPGTPSRVIWSPKRDKVLLYLTQTGTGNMVWYFADITNRTIAPLKAEISRLAWDNLGEKIFYQYTDPKTLLRTLNIANPDGSNWKKISDLGNTEVFIAPIPRSSMVSFWPRPTGESSTTLEEVSSNGEYRKTLFSGMFAGDFSWSPNGEYVLMSANHAKDGSGLSLHLLKKTGGEPKNLSIPTLISKTAWSEDGRTLYYALPGSLPQGTILPNDYFNKPLRTKDTFWKMDIDSGKKTRLVDLEEVDQFYDSSELFLSPDEDFLYFIDRASQKLYRVEI